MCHSLPYWTATEPAVLLMCERDMGFKLRTMTTEARDKEIMIKSAIARLKRLGIPVPDAPPPPPTCAPCVTCGEPRTFHGNPSKIARAIGTDCAKCASKKQKLANAKLKRRACGSQLLAKSGLVQHEERILDGERWYVANAQFRFESGVRVAMYPVGRVGRKGRQLSPAQVLALPKAEARDEAV